MKPQLSRLRSLLSMSPYSGPSDEDQHDDKHKVSENLLRTGPLVLVSFHFHFSLSSLQYSFEMLLEKVQASETELTSALKDIEALLLEGT